jgi:hypothetical protein
MDAPSSSKLISVMTFPKQVTPFVQNGGHDTPSIFRGIYLDNDFPTVYTLTGHVNHAMAFGRGWR